MEPVKGSMIIPTELTRRIEVATARLVLDVLEARDLRMSCYIITKTESDKREA